MQLVRTAAPAMAAIVLALTMRPAAADPRTQKPVTAPAALVSRAIDVRAERFDELRSLLFEQHVRSSPEMPKRFTDRLPSPTESAQRR
jgi:hypothetical protein